MKKGDYYKIMHPRVIERISDKTLVEDMEIVKYLNDNSSPGNSYLKLYCASRDDGVEMYHKLLKEEKTREM